MAPDAIAIKGLSLSAGAFADPYLLCGEKSEEGDDLGENEIVFQPIPKGGFD